MGTDAEILHPDRELTVAGKKITVRELAYPAALKLLSMLSGSIDKLMDGKGEVRMDVGVITQLIASSTELFDFVLEKTTDLDEPAKEELLLGQAIELIGAGIELNLKIVLERGKKMAGHFQQFADMQRTVTPAASAKSTSSSSSTDTAGQT
jgi:hypothetical protein